MAMQKAIFSGPFAALESTQKRIDLLTRQRQPTADERQEVADLQAFAEPRPYRREQFQQVPAAAAYLPSAGAGELRRPGGPRGGVL